MADTGAPGAHKDLADLKGHPVGNGLFNPELRSSCGECTSGESNTRKASPGAKADGIGNGDNGSGDNSNQDNSNDADEQAQIETGPRRSAQKAGSPEPATRQNQMQQAPGTAITKPEPGTLSSGASGRGFQATSQNGKTDKPKLPRPETPVNCPRCDSGNTKFCYYNNYNIKQPRYFCKACQRYWTAGGTLRNVPVGAGKRKNKSTAARLAEQATAQVQGGAVQAQQAAAQQQQQQQAVAAANLQAGGYNPFRYLLMDSQLSYNPASLANPMLPGAAGRLGPITGFLDPTGLMPSGFGGLPGGLGNPFMAQPADSGVSEDGSVGGRRTRMRLDAGASTAASELSGPFPLPHLDACAPATPLDSKGGAAPLGPHAGFPPFQLPLATGGLDPLALNGGSVQTGDWLPNAGQQQQHQQQQQQQQQAQYQQAAQQQLHQAQAQLQQAATLQAVAAGWGAAGQNPYLPGMWPYNLYGASPQWANAAAYAGLPGWNAMEVASGPNPRITSGAPAAMPRSLTPTQPLALPISAALPNTVQTSANSPPPQHWQQQEAAPAWACSAPLPLSHQQQQQQSNGWSAWGTGVGLGTAGSGEAELGGGGGPHAAGSMMSGGSGNSAGTATDLLAKHSSRGYSQAV